MRVKRLQVHVARVGDQHPDREPGEDRDLERAEDHARSRGDADVAVGEQEDDHRHQQRPDPPLPGVVPARLVGHDLGHRPAELEVEEGCDERLEQDEQPRDVEAGPGAERARRVGIQPAGGRLELRQLPDRIGRAQAGDERQQHRERERLLRRRDGDVDRVRNGRRRGHMRDRLEEHLREPDRVHPQAIERTRRNDAGFHQLYALLRSWNPASDPPTAARCMSSARPASLPRH